ncbi:MAG: sulfite exporter TauE/SafE family protein [bacterium]
MNYEFIVFIFSFIAGIGAGLLGIGGGIIIIPAFLFIVPLFTTRKFDMAHLTGISSAQALFSSFLAFLSHKKNGFIDKDILIKTTLPVVMGTFSGSFLSKIVPEQILMIMYLCILTILIFSYFKKRETTDLPKHATQYSFLVFFGCSFFTGALGLGGAIFFIPALQYFYSLPMINSIGNVTFLVLVGAFFSFIGKSISGQMPFELLIYILLGAFAGAKIGVNLAKKADSVLLKRLLFVVILLTAVRVGYSLFEAM